MTDMTSYGLDPLGKLAAPVYMPMPTVEVVPFIQRSEDRRRCES